MTENFHPMPACGCWINLFDPAVGELIGRLGYDYALIDMEHSPVDLSAALPMVRAVQAGGAKAIVRVPSKHPQWISRIMDMGADGALVPMVNSGEEAQAVAEATIYAPEGQRGMAAGIVRASGYGANLTEYLETCRERFLLIVQIETRMALDALDDIAAIKGIDGIFIGPFDLSGSLGYPSQPDHPATKAAIDRIATAAHAAGKWASILTTPETSVEPLYQSGFDLVFSGSDIALLRESMRDDVAQCRQAMAARQTDSG